MGEQAEVCWKEAAECWRLAWAATDSGVRLMYFELADRWRDAAESAEALDRKREGTPWWDWGNDRQMNRVIFENKLDLVTFTLDGHLVHTHKTTFIQRRSVDSWSDFESAKEAVETDLGHLRWEDPQ
jgi:hypothetical protein